MRVIFFRNRAATAIPKKPHSNVAKSSYSSNAGEYAYERTLKFTEVCTSHPMGIWARIRFTYLRCLPDYIETLPILALVDRLVVAE